MPVYFISLHACRSWRPNHRRGYVRRNKAILPPDAEMAEQCDRLAKQAPVLFTNDMQRVLIVGAHDICVRRKWRLHGLAFEPSHMHLLISWRETIGWLRVRAILKNMLSLFLGRWANQKNRKGFVDGGSRKQVVKPDHFNYLMTDYLPKKIAAKNGLKATRCHLSPPIS